jgi:hypothetical protein
MKSNKSFIIVLDKCYGPLLALAAIYVIGIGQKESNIESYY